MCKHILNVQVAIQAPCCGKWFDCPQCHAEQEDHDWQLNTIVSYSCKKCMKAFQKDMSSFEESDEYCPHCNNHFVIEAKLADDALAEAEVARLKQDAEDRLAGKKL